MLIDEAYGPDPHLAVVDPVSGNDMARSHAKRVTSSNERPRRSTLLASLPGSNAMGTRCGRAVDGDVAEADARFDGLAMRPHPGLRAASSMMFDPAARGSGSSRASREPTA